MSVVKLVGVAVSGIARNHSPQAINTERQITYREVQCGGNAAPGDSTRLHIVNWILVLRAQQ